MRKTALLCLLLGLSSPRSVWAMALDIPEMDIHLQQIESESPSENPTNFTDVSNNSTLEILGKGAVEPGTGEILSLVCLNHSDSGQCDEVQAASYVRHHIFLFGSRYRFADIQRILPGAFFDQKGWNWDSKPAKLRAREFYRIKMKLARREINELEKNFQNYIGSTQNYYSLGAQGCFSDIQISRDAIRSSLFLYDVQIQVANLFVAAFDCAGSSGLTFRERVWFDEALTPSQKRVVHRAEKRGEMVQFGGYPYSWSAEIVVLDRAGKEIFRAARESSVHWKQKKANETGASQAHALLFSFIPDGNNP